MLHYDKEEKSVALRAYLEGYAGRDISGINLSIQLARTLRYIIAHPGLAALDIPSNLRGTLRTLETMDLATWGRGVWHPTPAGKAWLALATADTI